MSMYEEEILTDGDFMDEDCRECGEREAGPTGICSECRDYYNRQAELEWEEEQEEEIDQDIINDEVEMAIAGEIFSFIKHLKSLGYSDEKIIKLSWFDDADKYIEHYYEIVEHSESIR